MVRIFLGDLQNSILPNLLWRQFELSGSFQSQLHCTSWISANSSFVPWVWQCSQWSHQASTRQVQIISAFEEDLTHAQATSFHSICVSTILSISHDVFLWYGILCRDSCTKLLGLTSTGYCSSKQTHTRPRYLTCMNWAFAQLGVGSSSAKPVNSLDTWPAGFKTREVGMVT